MFPRFGKEMSPDAAAFAAVGDGSETRCNVCPSVTALTGPEISRVAARKEVKSLWMECWTISCFELRELSMHAFIPEIRDTALWFGRVDMTAFVQLNENAEHVLAIQKITISVLQVRMLKTVASIPITWFFLVF
jgi:hypothetical protein